MFLSIHALYFLEFNDQQLTILFVSLYSSLLALAINNTGLIFVECGIVEFQYWAYIIVMIFCQCAAKVIFWGILSQACRPWCIWYLMMTEYILLMVVIIYLIAETSFDWYKKILLVLVLMVVSIIQPLFYKTSPIYIRYRGKYVLVISIFMDFMLSKKLNSCLLSFLLSDIYRWIVISVQFIIVMKSLDDSQIFRHPFLLLTGEVCFGFGLLLNSY